MVFKANFNNISVISWLSVLLVEETGVLEENYRPVASHRHTLSHNIVSSTHHLSDIRTHNFSGDRHWLQLPYDHGHEGSGIIIKKTCCWKSSKRLPWFFTLWIRTNIDCTVRKRFSSKMKNTAICEGNYNYLEIRIVSFILHTP